METHMKLSGLLAPQHAVSGGRGTHLPKAPDVRSNPGKGLALAVKPRVPAATVTVANKDEL
eukprot:6183999-Pleurochrysis_carterae.AAC.3